MRVALLQVEPTGKMKTQHHLCHSIVSQSFGSSISCMHSTNAGMHLLSVSSCGQIRYLQHAKPSIFMILYGFCQKNKFELKSPIFLVLRERERERERENYTSSWVRHQIYSLALRINELHREDIVLVVGLFNFCIK